VKERRREYRANFEIYLSVGERGSRAHFPAREAITVVVEYHRTEEQTRAPAVEKSRVNRAIQNEAQV